MVVIFVCVLVYSLIISDIYISVIVFIKPNVPGILVNFEPQSVAGWIADGCYCGVFVGDE